MSPLAVALALAAIASGALADSNFWLNNPNHGDVLTIGSPFTLTWEYGRNYRSNSAILVLLRCPRSRSATKHCAQAARFSNLGIGDGSFAFTGTSDLDDGAFYRFQLLNTNTMDVATSGTFTFAPIPRTVDTT